MTCAGTESPVGASMAISMSSKEPITLDNVKNDVLPTAVAANACPDTMMWLGSEMKYNYVYISYFSTFDQINRQLKCDSAVGHEK